MPPIIHIQETESTNSYLRQLLAEVPLEEGSIVSACHQSAGRGQRGNSWESEEGKNLTFSMVLYPAFVDIHEQFILSQLVSLAIKKVLDTHCEYVTIKWPNDIYWQEKKICGILIENTLSEEGILNTIIGIGLNINQSKFISDAPNPISLAQIANKEYQLDTILSDLQTQICNYYNQLQQGKERSIVEEYKRSLFWREGIHSFCDTFGTFQASIKDVEPSGHLVLETETAEIKRYAFKEVKYLI